MPRPPRIDFPDAVYHVTSRGNGRADIFYSDEDRQRFLAQLAHHLHLCAVGVAARPFYFSKIEVFSHLPIPGFLKVLNQGRIESFT